MSPDSIRSLALDEALKCIKMTQRDLTLRKDYVDIDSFRLEIINELMIDPMKSLDHSRKMSSQLLSSAQSLTDLIFCSGSEMGYQIQKEKSKIENEKMNLEKSLLLFLNKDQGKLTRSEKRIIDHAVTLPRKLRESLSILLRGMVESRLRMVEVAEDLTQDEIDSLKNHMPSMLEEDIEDEFKSAEELDREQKYEEELLEEMTPILEKIKRDVIFQAGADMARSLDQTKEMLYGLVEDELPKNRQIFEKDTVLYLKSDWGDVIVGGTRSNRYHGSPALVIDLGGDDEYYLSHDKKKNRASTVIIDLGGDDLYKAKNRFVFGSGFFGLGFLVDKQGDDLYMAQNFSLGSGLFGVGILLDEEGNDKYLGDTHTQGAGSFGLGVLLDLHGSDEYSASLFAQGFGYVAGFGALVDSAGNDSYFAGGKYKDVLRYEDHYISLSQGFAIGSRPDLSGGIGILCDGDGNDVYNSDIFGQGSSYWFALGALLDHAGNDKYVSYQYAQGAGIHLSLGVLIDEAGDDVYISKGVSQGCGHDLAFGLLLDRQGDDSYSAYDLSQGAGSANGIGVIIDESGDDGYLVKRTHNTQGYGNPRREYGSIGLFLDLSGKDHYDGNGADNSYWIIPSRWGAGVDFDFGKRKTVESEE